MALVLGTLATVAFFLAQGTTGLVASSAFPIDRTTAAAPARQSRRAAPARRQRDDTAILRRNIFDSETGPLDGVPTSDVETDDPAEPVEELDPNRPPPACEGSIRLVASVVNPRRDDWSFAAIIGAAGKAMLFRVGQEVDGREVLQILPHRVILRPASNSPCQIVMFNEEGPVVAARTPTAPPPQERPARPSREGAIASADLEAGISRNSDSNFTIQRSLVDRILENQGELMRTARIIPHEDGGRVVGVKVYGIRRNSLLGRLGVQNGDMLRTINGYDMSSPDSALEAYARLRSADHLTLSVVRRGQPMTIDYNIQ
ncbi:MAG: type II secretion system protein GspC [Myxococcota bacterium]